MKTLVIGKDIEVFAHTTKQTGYGRQHLYIYFYYEGKRYEDVYVMDVFPNVLEHFSGQAILSQDAFYQEEKDYFVDMNGNGEYTLEQVFSTTDDILNYVLNGREIEIDEEDEEEE